MKWHKTKMEAFRLAGFIETSQEAGSHHEEDIPFSSWGEEKEVCPYCGEDHTIHHHNELHWEEYYLPHKLFKLHSSELCEENIATAGKKYEVVRFSGDINDQKMSYNIVGMKVRDLNSVPEGFVAMAFEACECYVLKTTMEEFYNLRDNDLHKRNLADYFIIEYELENNKPYSETEITLWYPLKRE